MSATLLSGKEVSASLLEELAPQVKELDPKLVIVQVGEDPASASYIKAKIKACDSIGMRHEHVHLEEKISLEDLFAEIEKLNSDDDVTGFIIQLPLPEQLQKSLPQIIRAIDPQKDVDGFQAYNLGKMFLSPEFEHLPPATPAGIMKLLEYYKIPIEGKHAVVVGHGTVGKPAAVMLLNRNATVSVCHKYTPDISSLTKMADILVVAVGKAGLITGDMIKPGATVIDVGISRTEDGLKGDVDFETAKDIAGAITPVPGGVGPMTVASLMQNVVNAKKRQLQKVD